MTATTGRVSIDGRVDASFTPTLTEREILAVRDLSVSFPTECGPLAAVRGMSYSVARGEVIGIVGESGAGKSVAALAVMGLLPATARVSGSVRFRGTELLGLGDRELSAIRGQGVSMVFQDPLSSLTPVYTVGDQIAEAVRVHRKVSRKAAAERAVELLELVGIPRPAQRATAFPHELSGGMRQRVMIAMAMANDPDVIIADEPTTALDVTVQAQVLKVLQTVQEASGAAIVLITHDLGVIAELAHRVMVMYAGRVVETGTADDIFYRSRMPYTLGLLGSVPRPDAPGHQPLTPIEGTPPSPINLPPGCPFAPRCPLQIDRCTDTEPDLGPISGARGRRRGHAVACHRADEIETRQLSSTDVFPMSVVLESPAVRVQAPGEPRPVMVKVRDLVKHYPLTKGTLFRRRVGTVRAVDGVSFDLREGETLGLVGESGCGKTTTITEILRLEPPMGGSVVVLGHDIASLGGRARQALRRHLGVVFQDPLAALDPRMPVSDILAEGLRTHGVPKDQQAARVSELLRLVGLETAHASRYPQELSGGQCQRVGIARALALEPKVVVLDEPVSALDVSVRAGVINLLEQLRARLDLSYLFVAHDLAVVRHIADRVAVMHLGRIVEIGVMNAVFDDPAHPYTQALLSAIPLPDPRQQRRRHRIILEGDKPSPTDPPSGCRFRTQCPLFAALDDRRRQRCIDDEPVLADHGLDPDHQAACHYAQMSEML